MRVRVFVILVLIIVLCAAFPGTPAAIRPGAAAELACPSPPDGLELPVDQAIEIRCRLEAPSPAVIEFLVDGVRADSQAVSPGAAAILAWLPAEVGEYALTMVAYIDGRQVTRATRQVRVVPAGSPVRVP